MGATTHYPQRSVFSAPVLECHPSHTEQPSLVRSDQQQPSQSNARSQSVHPAQSGHPSQSLRPVASQSAHPSHSNAVTQAVESGQQEVTSHQATPRLKPGLQSEQHQQQQTMSIQPSTQTPFNVVTSGESGHPALKRQQSSAANGASAAAADKQRMAPPAAVDGFNVQISPFLAQSERSLHIQHAPVTQSAQAAAAATEPHSSSQEQKLMQPMTSRSGSFTYASAYPAGPCMQAPAQGQGQTPQQEPHPYGSNVQSHMSSSGSVGGWQLNPYHYQPQHQQQAHLQQHMPPWAGYAEVSTSPRHPGAWPWPDGVAQSQLEGLQHSGSSKWELQPGRPPNFLAPSQADWQEQHMWQSAQGQPSDASGKSSAAVTELT